MWKYNNPSIPECSSFKCSQESLLNNKKNLEDYLLMCRSFFVFVVECVGRNSGKQKHWRRLNGIELTLCSSSGDAKSCCWFIQPRQWLPSTARFQIALCRAMLQTHIPFLSLMNHLSLLLVPGPGFSPEAATQILRGRADLGHGRLFTQMLEGWLDTVYLKKSEGVMVHKDERDGLVILKRHKSICHNKPREMLLVKAYSLPGFPLQPEPSQ